MARVVLIGGICGACASAVPAWRSGYVVSGDGFWCIRSPEMQRWLLPGELEERMQVRDAQVKRRDVAQDSGMD